MPEFYIGLMSGTSMDGVDAVLVDFSDNKPRVVQHASTPLGPDLRTEFLALNTSGADELHRAALAANALVRLYASLVQELLSSSRVSKSEVLAIGAHGQTVRHRPQCFDGVGYTLQLNSPALLAELSGIDVIADFRSRDVAAGGQGAPLVPAFHLEMFGHPGQTIAVLNIGGISNLSVLDARGPAHATVTGFDCGPGNALMDYWCQRHTGHNFDAAGAWAATGQVVPALLEQLAGDPFFALPPPKSTGRDLFNPKWLVDKLGHFPQVPAQDVQATLTELTAMTCCATVEQFAPDCKTLIVCGGGALNALLMHRLDCRLPSVHVQSSAAHSLPPQQVEAAAFAWLARKTMRRETGNLRAVTGARAERILGAIYPA
jgi:anhydro-N-acetylmuramic acid kinase